MFGWKKPSILQTFSVSMRYCETFLLEPFLKTGFIGDELIFTGQNK